MSQLFLFAMTIQEAMRIRRARIAERAELLRLVRAARLVH